MGVRVEEVELEIELPDEVVDTVEVAGRAPLLVEFEPIAVEVRFPELVGEAEVADEFE